MCLFCLLGRLQPAEEPRNGVPRSEALRGVVREVHGRCRLERQIQGTHAHLMCKCVYMCMMICVEVNQECDDKYLY